jgi:hypothetical protein
MATNCYPIVTDIVGNKSWITHRVNGQFTTIDDFEMPDELIWALKTKKYRNEAVANNRLFLKKC